MMTGTVLTQSNEAPAWPEVRTWRKTARAKLIAARIAVPAQMRAEWTAAIIAQLRPLLLEAPPPISFYWPFKAEPDFRPLMRELDAAGVAVALPVAFKLGEAMTFRPWHRRCEMARGIWDIPIPADPTEILPLTVIAPVVGFDLAHYRLGYGGGFFDRTLEKLGDKTQAIGVGFSMFRLETIHPQPHDIPMARIVTEIAEVAAIESAGKVCYADEMAAGYAGYLSPAELAAELAPLVAALPPERAPLLDLLLWRLGVTEQAPAPPPISPSDAIPRLKALLPRVKDDAQHRVLLAAIGGLETAS